MVYFTDRDVFLFDFLNLADVVMKFLTFCPHHIVYIIQCHISMLLLDLPIAFIIQLM